MKNRTHVMEQRNQSKILDWLYQEEEKDDFLMGKTPKDLSNTWDEEE